MKKILKVDNKTLIGMLCIIIIFVFTIVPFSKEIVTRLNVFISFSGFIFSGLALIRTIQVQTRADEKYRRDSVRSDLFEMIRLINENKRGFKTASDQLINSLKRYYNTGGKGDLAKDYGIFASLNNQDDLAIPLLRTLKKAIENINKAYEKNIIDRTSYLEYIEVIRIQFNKNELETILLFSTLSRKNIDLGIELIDTNFFGNAVEVLAHIHIDNYKYFNRELLELFPCSDVEVVTKFKLSNKISSNIARNRVYYRLIYSNILKKINSEINDKKRKLLINRLTSTSF